MKYLISYDLKKPGQNYNGLIDMINGYESSTYISDSCWSIRSNKTAMQIRDDLMKCIDSNDTLFVCAFETWASCNLPQKSVEWLNR